MDKNINFIVILKTITGIKEEFFNCGGYVSFSAEYIEIEKSYIRQSSQKDGLIIATPIYLLKNNESLQVYCKKSLKKAIIKFIKKHNRIELKKECILNEITRVLNLF